MRQPHRYRDLSIDEQEELLSNYLLNRWSYSKVNTFSRNEKAFEMQYIYGLDYKSSSTTVAGQAYHKALELYFNKLKDGEVCDIVDMGTIAFKHIDDVEANKWKLQKSTPTVDECIQNATKITSVLINNFLTEVEVYTSKINRVLGVELRLNEWIKVNGVDIPLPCDAGLDLPIETIDGQIVIIDHKSKKSFTNEKDAKFSNSKQAIIYALAYEAATGLHVDEVWFIENKYSKNRDKSAQLVPIKIILDDDTRRLYEAMLYEPLRRMLDAVSDPDYVYIINESDNLTDSAEIHDFWAQTMIAEVDDFNIPDNKKELITNRLRKIRDSSLATVSPNVLKNFQKYTEQFIPYDLSNKNMAHEEKIQHVLRSFGIPTEVKYTFSGYSSESFLLEVNAGIPLSSIHKHRLDIANALNVASVRILKDLFVYEGRSYLAVESGKKRTESLMWSAKYLDGMKIPFGVDNFGNSIYWDLDNPSTPHVLICGATGSGKSVSIKSTIEYALLAGISEIFIFDPKFEFTSYSRIQGVTVISHIEEIELQMMLLVEEMDRRVKSGSSRKTLIIFDEFADAVANSRKGKELNNYKDEIVGLYKNGLPKTKRVVGSVDKSLEENLKILLQKGRSSGFRIMAATQRASTKVITGDAKVNFPVQICFRVPKEVDSMVVIDEPGAESLNGRGDGLIKSPEYLNVVRFQAFYKE